jgi:hypothetical protein
LSFGVKILKRPVGKRPKLQNKKGRRGKILKIKENLNVKS